MGPAVNRRERLMAPTTQRSPMPITLAVALGGALGSVTRYGLDRLIERRSDSLFPWSTFAINMSGCLLIGIVIAALVDRHHAPVWLRTGLVIGVLGGYTTFSTFGQESLDLLETHVAVALGYIGGSVGSGVVAVFVGSRVGRLL
jgi:fluoride exporter